MRLLKAYHPVLIGSVWRGTIRKGSDIDIAVYHDAPDEVLCLVKTSCKVAKAEWVTVTKKGEPQASFHIHGNTSIDEKVEIVARSSEEAGQRENARFSGTSSRD